MILPKILFFGILRDVAFFQQKTSNIVTKKTTKSFNIGHFTP